MSDKIIVGSLEICHLPDIGIQDIQMRVDTGAKTSSLHVDNLATFKRKGKPWVGFDLHPDVHKVDEVIHCEAPLHDVRRIKSSNGATEERYVVRTAMLLGGHSWQIDISLTDRSDMTNLMLLGREGMRDKVLVDPSQTFLLNGDDDSNDNSND